MQLIFAKTNQIRLNFRTANNTKFPSFSALTLAAHKFVNVELEVGVEKAGCEIAGQVVIVSPEGEA